ncbi:MAG: hypothetical protein AAGJ40_14340 [Planctomycetota bacterium]
MLSVQGAGRVFGSDTAFADRNARHVAVSLDHYPCKHWRAAGMFEGQNSYWRAESRENQFGASAWGWQCRENRVLYSPGRF